MRFIHILRRFGVVRIQTAIAAIRRALFAIVGQIWVVGSWLRLLPIQTREEGGGVAVYIRREDNERWESLPDGARELCVSG